MISAALGLSAALSAALAQPAPQPDAFAITEVTIIDVAAPTAASALKTNQTVVVMGDRSTDVGATSATRVPPGARPIDGGGKFLIPGLWDMHAHLVNTEDRVEYFPLLFIANGITGVRDMGAAIAPARIREIRASIDRGDTMGPRIAAVAHHGSVSADGDAAAEIHACLRPGTVAAGSAAAVGRYRRCRRLEAAHRAPPASDRRHAPRWCRDAGRHRRELTLRRAGLQPAR